jgi:hypothetical protein
MKRYLYIAATIFSSSALIGTAGASDFENLSVLATFLCTLFWTGLFCVFGMLSLYELAKKKAPRGTAIPTKRTTKKPFLVYPNVSASAHNRIG